MKFPDQKVVPIDDLVPYARNARTHSKNQIDQLAASIDEFGFLNPVIIDGDNGIVAGHGRVLAAQQIGMTEVPCVEASHLTEAQRRAYVLADNKLALNAGWDPELLRAEISDIQAMDFDTSLIGFSESEMSQLLLNYEGETDPDDTPDEPADPVSEPGTVWQLGDHRLVCGDAANADDVTLALDGTTPHLMVTDPPYGVDYDANWRNGALDKNGNLKGRVGSCGRAVGKVDNDNNAEWGGVWQLFPGDVVYVWHAGNKAHIVAVSLMESGFDIRTQIIWAKNNIVVSRGHYHGKHEPCWYAVRKGKAGHWQGSRQQSTLWEIPKPQKSETGHSTQKPVECMKRPIENNSAPGDAVYEPFCGSGTTIIAAEMTRRRCYAIEINPIYVDMAVMRWQNFTGKDATREDGATYNELAALQDGT